MVDRATSVLPDRLALGVRQFEQWRAQQDRRRRLPDHLWSLAVELAREFGVSRTAKTLRLAHNTLKHKSLLHQEHTVSEPGPSLSFLELRTDTGSTPVECTIECERSSGQKIRMDLKGSHWPDLPSLCKALWAVQG